MRLIRWSTEKLGAQPWLTGDAPLVARLDRVLRAVSSGHVSLPTLSGLPELVLTVREAGSGQPRSTPILCTPVAARGAMLSGDVEHAAPAWIVVGTTWGASREPDWVGNLRAVAERGIGAVVDVRDRSHTVTARELHGAEREAAWAQAVRTWPHHERYEARATHELSVWLLVAQ